MARWQTPGAAARPPLAGTAPAGTVTLAPGRERSVLRWHPWIFSGAIERVEGRPGPGDTVAVEDHAGKLLAWAAWSPVSRIRARIWSFDPAVTVEPAFFRQRLRAALALRRDLGLAAVTDAMRLVHGESDGLPGLVVDRYGPVLVLQALAAGAERWKRQIADMLLAETGAATVYERSDAEVRRLEGLDPCRGLLAGRSLPRRLTIQEHGLVFLIDCVGGQKTGFFLDQRDSRLAVRRLAAGREVLDCFCYTGGFTCNVVAGGAQSVLAVDSSAAALQAARENCRLSGLDCRRVEWREADVFQELRRLRDAGRTFDLVILDPPKFAPTAALARQAARGYKDINLLACKLLRPGGILVTFSCSGGVSPDLFQKIVAGAAQDAGVAAQVIGRSGQAADHPVSLAFPESEYLKGLVVRIAGKHSPIHTGRPPACSTPAMAAP